MIYNLSVPCLLGMEKPISDELKDMGAENVMSDNGRVDFTGDESIIARANICSRYSERIQIIVGSFEAHSFEELFENTKKLDWTRYINKNDKFPVKGYSLNSDLFSVSDCQAIIKKAIVESLKSKYNVTWFNETEEMKQIQFSIMKNKVTLFIDTSGVGLHKRGYRPEANQAPIKETLAAALCYFSRLRPYHTLYDPMCGSGTIIIEGAMLAANIAPGLNRTFTCEDWRLIDKSIWTQERERAKSLEKRDISFRGYGSDIDSDCVKLSKMNAKKAGVGDFCSFETADVKNFQMKTETGTIITNPPYGERMLDADSVSRLYTDLGSIFKQKRGVSYSIITADEDFEREFGRRADKRRKLYNGMLKCQLYMYFK